MDIDARAFGQLEGQVMALTKMLVDQNVVLAELKKDMATIRTSMDQAAGGWKTMVVFGSMVATLSGAVAWLVQHLSK